MSTAVPAFSDLGLSAPVLTAIARTGYETPSPIQIQSIPVLLAGQDLLGTAQTGTGKTAAFALPLLSRLDANASHVQILILTPTRELAIQVAEAVQTYACAIKGFHVLPLYGGQDMGTQLKQLRRNPQVIVGTPGRVMDHLRRGSLKLDQLSTVVLDEADEMLRMGFIEDVTWILDHTPEQRQVALFSATMPAPIRKIADTYLRDPAVVNIQSKTATVDRIEQRYWLVGGIHKLDALTRMLDHEPCDGTIIFVRTRTQTIELAEKLEARGYAAAPISGEMTQAARERTIEHLKNGKIDIVVATDVAARGIDVPRVSHVINYDIPYDTEAYVHRIGRTGRAGREGKAILFVAPREKRLLFAIEKATRQKILPMTLPSRDEINVRRVEKFKEDISEAMADQNLDQMMTLIESCASDYDGDLLRVAAAVACLLHGANPILLTEPDPPAAKPLDAQQREPRGPREPREPRGGKDTRPPRRHREDTGPEEDMERYTIAVGRNQNATPGDIVGAIANEAGLDSTHIGRIFLHDDHSTVDLPSGMPSDVFQHLRRVRVRNHPLLIEKWSQHSGKTLSVAPGKSRRKPADDDARRPSAKSNRSKGKRRPNRPMPQQR